MVVGFRYDFKDGDLDVIAIVLNLAGALSHLICLVFPSGG